MVNSALTSEPQVWLGKHSVVLICLCLDWMCVYRSEGSSVSMLIQIKPKIIGAEHQFLSFRLGHCAQIWVLVSFLWQGIYLLGESNSVLCWHTNINK